MLDLISVRMKMGLSMSCLHPIRECTKRDIETSEFPDYFYNMKKLLLIAIIMLPFSLYPLSLQQELAVGYYDDLGITLGLRLEDEKSHFPVYIQGRLGITYQFDPGNAEDARKIFINDNQGGNIQEHGQSYLLALDLGWKILQKDSLQLELNVSGIMNHYNAHFAFIGNNEAFIVRTTAMGIGLGGGMNLDISDSQTSLIIKGGVEYFPKSRIDAHGTYYYTPDGNDDKTRQDYGYSDADGSINQPVFRPYMMVGIIFPIG